MSTYVLLSCRASECTVCAGWAISAYAQLPQRELPNEFKTKFYGFFCTVLFSGLTTESQRIKHFARCKKIIFGGNVRLLEHVISSLTCEKALPKISPDLCLSMPNPSRNPCWNCPFFIATIIRWTSNDNKVTNLRKNWSLYFFPSISIHVVQIGKYQE